MNAVSQQEMEARWEEAQTASEPIASKSEPVLLAAPYRFPNPETIPPRKFLFGRHAIRKFVSATVAAGGTGKTALAIAEQLALASGKDLLLDHVKEMAPTWYIGLEDPLEEYERRVAAAIKHYDLQQADFAGGLFLNSGRDQDFVIAREVRDGVQIAMPVIEGIMNQIRRHNIALVTVDPFVASHTVRENDNGSIEQVARMWAHIADVTGAAIELIHHVRKGAPGGEMTADDARGARALVDKARSVRLLSPMSLSEAGMAGVEERRRYFKVTFGKANLSLPPENGIWRCLESVNLGNGDGGPDDLVGVATLWEWPSPFDDVTAADLEKVCAKLSTGEWRADAQAKAWAGIAVAEVLGLNADDKAVTSKIKGLVKTWTKNGALRIETKSNSDRKKVDYLVPVR